MGYIYIYIYIYSLAKIYIYTAYIRNLLLIINYINLLKDSHNNTI